MAAGRLGKALEQAGIQVDKLVRKDTWLNRFRFYWERLIIFLCNHLNRKNLFAVSIANTGMDLSGHPSVILSIFIGLIRVFFLYPTWEN